MRDNDRTTDVADDVEAIEIQPCDLVEAPGMRTVGLCTEVQCREEEETASFILCPRTLVDL